MISPIFVVSGSCGEYSDRREWIVCWFATEEEAKAYAKACEEQSNAVPEEARYDGTAKTLVPSDPYWRTDYTGTTYCVERVERGPVTP